MEHTHLEGILNKINELRKTKELSFSISRAVTQLNISPGIAWARLSKEGTDFAELQYVAEVITPVLLALASGEEDNISIALAQASAQLNISDQSLIRNILEPSISDEFRNTYFHRTGSHGNLLIGASAALLWRHHIGTNEQFPFTQLRIDYLDNNMQQPGTMSLVLELSKGELNSLLDGLTKVRDILTNLEEGR